jgi:hypothetical protein
VLHLGGRSQVVPDAVVDLLFDPQRYRFTADVTGDILRLDAELRGLDRRLAGRAAAAAVDVTTRRAELAQTGSVKVSCRRREAQSHFDDAVRTHAVISELHTDVVSYLDILRSFVVTLDPQEGLLAEAAAGWSRSPDVPAGVAVFNDEDYFLTDSRRAAGPGAFPNTIGGEQLGDLWRRDGDDPVDQPLSRQGCWLVGYIERTQEIYAVRRSDSQRREVWLLGRGFTATRTHRVLSPLIPHMQEPNSLILAAEVVTAAQFEPDF